MIKIFLFVVVFTLNLYGVDVFKKAEGNYSFFRIPVLMKVEDTLLAFAEGRKKTIKDYGKIDTVLKRSTDNGKNWSKLQVIASDKDNYIGIPAPVYDKKNKQIVLFLTWKYKKDKESLILQNKNVKPIKIFALFSKDKGFSWSKPKDITKQVKKDNWTWYSTGPAKGVQLDNGRLLIPANHNIFLKDKKNTISNTTRSHIIYSDDGGNNWNIGAIAKIGTNEATITTIKGGGVMLNSRSYMKINKKRINRRYISISYDNGISFQKEYTDKNLIEPVCQASLINDNGILYFANPSSKKRENITIKYSKDYGKTWEIFKKVYSGKSAYSSLEVVDDKICILYENGIKSPYEKISFKCFKRQEFEK